MLPPYRLMIFGNPVAHSRSPLMHNYALRGLGIAGCYGRWKLEEGEKLRQTFEALDLHGANVTVPHKEAAFSACDTLDPFAQKVGAVNTIVRRGDMLHGYNTDAPGFLKTIHEFSGEKILMLGAGGTAQSTSVLLRETGYDVTVLNRSPDRLAAFDRAGFQTATFETYRPETYDLVINMTSAGLEEEHLPAPREILDAVIPSSQACVDVIYGKETPFLRLAKAHGKPAKDGTAMLLYQGALAFELFTAGAYGFDEILPHMRRAFENN